MTVIEAKGARSKIAPAGFTLENAEFPIEVTNVMKTFFYEVRGGFAVFVGTMGGQVVHERGLSKKEMELYYKISLYEVCFGRNLLLDLQSSEL